MGAPYDGRKIANLLLDCYDARAHDLTNKKINKLLYFVHGVALVRTPSGLVKNHFEAWDHGPVLKVVYDAFKRHIAQPITTRATAFNYVAEAEEVLRYDDVSASDRKLILRVADYYIKWSGDELEAMTHEVDSPWSSVWNMPARERGLSNRIPNPLIEEYFRMRLGSKSVN